ncbi:MAG: hypothetical protein R3D25_04425 [Geminicoccaceae bacterium]
MATAGVGMLSGVLMAVPASATRRSCSTSSPAATRSATNRANFTGYFALTLMALTIPMLIGGLIEIVVALAPCPARLPAGHLARQPALPSLVRPGLIGGWRLGILLAGLYGMTSSLPGAHLRR